MVSFVLFAACMLVLTGTNSAGTPKSEYVGCFVDRAEPYRAFAWHTGKTGFDNCFNLAVSKKLEYFGLQNGGECWMNENKNQQNEYAKHGPTNNCGAAGGSWSNKVYRIKYCKDDNPPWLIGCKKHLCWFALHKRDCKKTCEVC